MRFVTPDFAPSGGTLQQNTSVGDFDGDGNLDAITVNRGPDPVFGTGIGVSFGDGAGHLGATVTTHVGFGDGACDLAVGNWNSDGMDDVVVSGCVTSGAGDIVAFKSTGGGSFVETQRFAGLDVQLVAGDLNGDSKIDFVTSERGTPTVMTYLGKGNGTFKAPLTASPPFDSYDLEIGDVDDDGALDLIGADGGPIWTMLGDGDGTFGTQLYRFSDVVTGLELGVGDFDGDGTLDVATVDASGGHVGIGLGVGDGNFVDGDQISLGPQLVWVSAGRTTDDGSLDLVVGLDNDSNVSALLRGKGDGHFAKAANWVVGTAGLTTADFDGDDRQDLLAYAANGRGYLALAAGKGFRAAALTPGPLAEDLADVDGDGVLDKITGTTGLVRGSFKSQVIVQLGRGDGRFGKGIRSHVRNETVFSGIGDIEVADIDEDGTLDVVGGFNNFDPSAHNVFWMRGKGDGSFARATLSSVSSDAHVDVNSLAVADVDADGHVDIVANDTARLMVRLGTGTGTFSASIPSGVGSRNDQSKLVGDFTGDGVADVVTTVLTGTEDVGKVEIRLQRGGRHRELHPDADPNRRLQPRQRRTGRPER